MMILWEALPTSLTKLAIDVGWPLSIDDRDPHRQNYLSQADMKPLVNFTKLQELRIFNMRDTLQSIVWECVFRNKAKDKGMKVLDLQMAAAPLVRRDHWAKGAKVNGLHVINDDLQVYK